MMKQILNITENRKQFFSCRISATSDYISFLTSKLMEIHPPEYINKLFFFLFTGFDVTMMSLQMR